MKQLMGLGLSTGSTSLSCERQHGPDMCGRFQPSGPGMVTRYVSVLPGCLNGKHLYLTVPEAGKSKIKVPADSVPGEGLLPAS